MKHKPSEGVCKEAELSVSGILLLAVQTTESYRMLRRRYETVGANFPRCSACVYRPAVAHRSERFSVFVMTL
jgi:hypothetical protein